MSAPRFFVDETDLGLGKALSRARTGVVFPGHPDLAEVPRGSSDDHWLSIIGREGLVVIARDKRIRRRPVEKMRWVEYCVRGFVLTGKKSQSTTDSLAVLDEHWSEIERLVEAEPDGPWMFAVTVGRLRRIELGVGEG